ncbi:unnamed protein product [Symbiodinium natans]|uniref:Uncharacterized protein n=1 Tax=Symbiodinium natans TaxID=878477 RepID=A0A812KAK7_9DINO|nr:unnamed protein product [Symbiodinium natans]
MHFVVTGFCCAAAPVEKPHDDKVTEVAVLREELESESTRTEPVLSGDEVESRSSPTEVALSADPVLPVAYLTFTRPNGEPEVLEFTSRPLGFRISHTHPYTVTNIGAGHRSAVQPGWVLTHVDGEQLSVAC